MGLTRLSDGEVASSGRMLVSLSNEQFAWILNISKSNCQNGPGPSRASQSTPQKTISLNATKALYTLLSDLQTGGQLDIRDQIKRSALKGQDRRGWTSPS